MSGRYARKKFNGNGNTKEGGRCVQSLIGGTITIRDALLDPQISDHIEKEALVSEDEENK